jgi:hypothetical protein
VPFSEQLSEQLMHFLRKIFTFSNAKAGEIPLISAALTKAAKLTCPNL